MLSITHDSEEIDGLPHGKVSSVNQLLGTVKQIVSLLPPNKIFPFMKFSREFLHQMSITHTGNFHCQMTPNKLSK